MYSAIKEATGQISQSGGFTITDENKKLNRWIERYSELVICIGNRMNASAFPDLW